MSCKLEDYALIGDCHTAALVSRSGSIDWLCVPRFDSPACFAKLLGTEKNGCWQLGPRSPVRRVERRYRGETLVLETVMETETGSVAIIDCMPPKSEAVDVVRIVEGRSGRVPMVMDLVARFDYGSVVPWVTWEGENVKAIAGPHLLHLRSETEFVLQDHRVRSEFEVAAGQRLSFVLTAHPSHTAEPSPIDPHVALESTERWWQNWSERSNYRGPYRDAVQRSLVVLKALTYAPTGGLVAAPTTSLPEEIGGVRNWDYRYCWIRDATITLYALIKAGYVSEAQAFREWLLRAVAGDPSQLHIMYSILGERRLPELELDWLAGYEGSRPVRIGNAAHEQLQLDVWGELMDAMHLCRRKRLENTTSWELERALLEFLETKWQEPDNGIWEMRGPRRHFTHSKVMAWVAFDRGIRAIEAFGREGPAERWRAIRDEVHREVCARGYDSKVGAFTQSFESDRLDASLLMIPLVGFLPATDPRVRSTMRAIQRELVEDGLVKRYRCDPSVDGLPGEEGSFLACSFWLVDNLAMTGEVEEAERLFERLLSFRNDVGLLSEQYDAVDARMTGNFPQAFSHLALINTAQILEHAAKGQPIDRSQTEPGEAAEG